MEKGVFKEEEIRQTDQAEIRQVNYCWECPCYSDCCSPSCGLDPHLDFTGDPHDRADEDVHPNCPLKRKPVILHHPSQLIALEVDWKLTF